MLSMASELERSPRRRAGEGRFGPESVVMTHPLYPRPRPLTRQDMTAPADRADITLATLANEAIENRLAKEPIDPTDSADPTEPIDRTESREPIDRIEFDDPRLQRDVDTIRG
jgi:hypothetical protein